MGVMWDNHPSGSVFPLLSLCVLSHRYPWSPHSAKSVEDRWALPHIITSIPWITTFPLLFPGKCLMLVSNYSCRDWFTQIRKSLNIPPLFKLCLSEPGYLMNCLGCLVFHCSVHSKQCERSSACTADSKEANQSVKKHTTV